MENCQVVLDLFPIFILGKYFQYTPLRCYVSLTAEMIPFGIWSCTCTHHSLTADPWFVPGLLSLTTAVLLTYSQLNKIKCTLA